MKIEDTIEVLQQFLPKTTDPILLENLALQSSYIEFTRAGETLFRPGDEATGFYWILKGEITEVLGKSLHIKLVAGQMAGIEEFLEYRCHSGHWFTTGPAKVIFMDRRCFENLCSDTTSLQFLSFQMALHLLKVKDQIL